MPWPAHPAAAQELGGRRGGRGPVGTPHPTRARDLPETRRGEGPLRGECSTPSPFPRERSAENNGEPMGVGSKGGKRGRRPRSHGAGPRGGLGLGSRFPETPLLPCTLLTPRALPFPGGRAQLGDAGCAGTRGDARGCAALQARPRGPRGASHRGRDAGGWMVAASCPEGDSPPSPAQTSPKRALPPSGAGRGVPKRPAHSPPLLWSAFFGSRFSTAASGAPPGVGGSRGPASAPFSSPALRPPRRGAGCSARGQTTPPTDGRVSGWRTPGSRGWEAAVAALRGGKREGAEKEEGAETDRGPGCPPR